MGIAALGSMLLEMSHQFLDGTCLVEFGIVIALEHLQESPLCPLIVNGVTGAHFAVPIVAETYFVQLLAIAGNILISSDFRMLTRLDGILLGGQTIGIIAHGVQHVEALQALVAGINVTGNVAQRMSHMQTCSRRIGKHVQHIKFRTAIVNFTFIGVMITPILLPLFFYVFIVIFHLLSL